MIYLRLIRVVSLGVNILLYCALFIDFVFAGQLLQHFLHGGWRETKNWIVHIGTMGRVQITELGAGAATFNFPPEAQIFREFFITCTFLVLVTFGAWWGRRRLRRVVSRQG